MRSLIALCVTLMTVAYASPSIADKARLSQHFGPVFDTCIDFATTGRLPTDAQFLPHGWKNKSALGLRSYQKWLNIDGRRQAVAVQFYRSVSRCDITLLVDVASLDDTGVWAEATLKQKGFKRVAQAGNSRLKYTRSNETLTMSGQRKIKLITLSLHSSE